MVGPQFPFAVYKRFFALECFRHDKSDGKKTTAIPSGASAYALRCFLLGVFYFAYTQAGINQQNYLSFGDS